jgi:hypothetical protein
MIWIIAAVSSLSGLIGYGIRWYQVKTKLDVSIDSIKKLVDYLEKSPTKSEVALRREAELLKSELKEVCQHL